jgi:ribosomal protein S18 acetylase RimI-like enzyme
MSLTTFAPIQAYLRKSASRDRLTEQIGPFLATISPGDANPYLNYAIPNDDALPTSADVDALIAVYRRHERKPRLEYIADLAPQVEPALLAGGFTVEGRLPLMTYTPNAAANGSLPNGIELIAPQTDEEIQGASATMSEAYGGEFVPSPDVATRWRRFFAAGGIAALARNQATGEAAGSGLCDVPFSQTCELTSVAVRPAYRRRGIAAAMTAWLVDQAFAAGTTNVFLMAAGEDEARIYSRIGFTQIGSVLHISKA